MASLAGWLRSLYHDKEQVFIWKLYLDYCKGLCTFDEDPDHN